MMWEWGDTEPLAWGVERVAFTWEEGEIGGTKNWQREDWGELQEVPEKEGDGMVTHKKLEVGGNGGMQRAPDVCDKIGLHELQSVQVPYLLIAY